jgi:hypothetical protein
MAEENQKGLTGILGGIRKAAGKLLERKGEQGEAGFRDVPFFDNGGLQVITGMDEDNRPIVMDSSIAFMAKQYEEEGIKPEIIGRNELNPEDLVIRTPNGGTIMISVKDYLKNFGMPIRRQSRLSNRRCYRIKNVTTRVCRGSTKNIFNRFI